jgi:hypothetical protein
VLEFGIPLALLSLPRNAYDVAPDGRFLALQPLTQEGGSQIQVVINWKDEL